MQDMVALSEHAALISHEERNRLVRMLRFNPYPTHRGDVNLLGWLQDASARLQRRRRSDRPRYDLTITFSSDPPPPAPPRDSMQPGKHQPDAAPARRKKGPRR